MVQRIHTNHGGLGETQLVSWPMHAYNLPGVLWPDVTDSLILMELFEKNKSSCYIRGFFCIPWFWDFWQPGNNHVNNQSSHGVAPCSGTVCSRKYPQQVVQHCSLASVQCSDVHFVHIVSKQKQATKLCFSWKCSVGACEDEKCLLISHQPEYYLCTSVICISPCIETSVPLKVKIKYHLDWEVCIQFTSTS